MSNYITQYVPDQIMSMVSRLKEATIDVGPQPVKYAKFSSLPYENIKKLLSDNQSGNLNFQQEECNGAQSPLVKCLLIVTELAFEIWVLKQSSLQSKNTEIECIYRKSESGIELIDYIHISPSDGSTKSDHLSAENAFEGDHSDIQQDANSQPDDGNGVYDSEAPLVGYTNSQNQSLLKVFSLKSDKTLHILRFSSPVIKFQTSPTNLSNKLIILLQEGLLKIFNLQSMEQELNIKTFHLHPQKSANGSQAQSTLDSQLLAAAFPLDFDTSHNTYAYVYNEINEDDLIEQMNKNIDQSVLGQYFLTKEATKQLIQFGHASFNKVMNLLNVQKASSLDNQQIQQLISNQQNKQNYCSCLKTKKDLRNKSFQYPKAQNSTTSQIKGLQGLGVDGSLSSANGMGKRSRGNSDQLYKDDPSLKPIDQLATINKENVISVRIRDMETSKLFAEIYPPFFKNISLVKFSPSGRLLLVANENCQYFYIYEVLPQTNQRFSRCQNFCNSERLRLAYSLFRGYTAALVSDVQFVSSSSLYPDCEQLLIINSSNGTSHIFKLKKGSKLNQTPVQKVQGEDIQQTKVINLVAKTRFKYKSVIKQGVLRLVSLVSQKEPNKDQSKPGYRVLTYTSKNELYVIDIGKSKKQSPITTDDVGISTAEVDSEEEKMAQPTQADKNQMQLSTADVFQLNISQSSYTQVNKKTAASKVLKFYNLEVTTANKPQRNMKQQRQAWLKEIETNSFYPQMMIQQWMNPAVTLSEPNKEFLKINKKDKILFDFDLNKQLSLTNKQDLLVQAKPSSQNIMVEDENYFGGQSAIQNDEEESRHVNVSQYFDNTLADLDEALKSDVEDGTQDKKGDELHFAPQEQRHNDLKDSKILDFRFDEEYYS